MTTAHEIMHTGVETVTTDTALTEASRRMRDRDISALPVRRLPGCSTPPANWSASSPRGILPSVCPNRRSANSSRPCAALPDVIGLVVAHSCALRTRTVHGCSGTGLISHHLEV